MVREALTFEKLNGLEPRDAAAWFIARRAEGLTASEERLLTAWLARNEEHRLLFDSADRVWQTFAEPEGDEVLAAMRAHALAARPRAFAAWRPVAAAAAVLVLVVGTAVLLSPWAPESQHASPISSAAIKYVSARGEVKELRLPDGTSMTLDADSVAVGRFTDAGRSIHLQRGRAFFAIVPDRSRPFTVTAADRSVVAVGTRFDVNLTAEGLTVTLLDGRLKIGSQDSARAPVMLEPGQQYIERHGNSTIRTIGAAAENVIAWRIGLVNFDDQPLAEAAAVMNRYSREQIVISDPDIASIRVSGQFRARDAQRFAATLAEMHNLQSIRRDDRIELIRAK